MPKPIQPAATGEFSATCWYTFAELRKRGFGSAALREMQRAGLKSREVGKQKVVLGSDLLAHFESLPAVTLPTKGKP